MYLNSFPRSETDLAINIRKATSIGQSLQSYMLGTRVGDRIISNQIFRRDCTKTYIRQLTSVGRAPCAHGIQANTFEHASSTPGTISHHNLSGRA